MFKKFKNKSAIELEQQPISTIIGADIKITGDISGDTAIRIDGMVEGNVTVTKGVILGEKSSVRGNLKANDIVIYGKLNGTIHAAALHLKASGEVNGDINVDVVEIEAGGKYNGKLNKQGAHERNNKNTELKAENRADKKLELNGK